MRFDQKVSVPSHVLTRELQGEMVVLNLQSESYFGLDEVGTHIWKTLSSSTTIQHAFEDLLAEYDVDPEKLRADMQALLDNLVEKGLLILHEQ